MKTATVNPNNNRVYNYLILPARYKGTYSDGECHCWPVRSTEYVPGEAYASDVPCGKFWAEQIKSGVPMVGKGGDPSTALEKLRQELLEYDQVIGYESGDRIDPKNVPGLKCYYDQSFEEYQYG
jgi:hypothetical protein